MSEKTVKLTNYQMDQYIFDLEPFLDRKDIIGYAAARNTRLLANASLDHVKIKTTLLQKYGKPVIDENGNKTDKLSISSDDEHYDEVATQIDISGSLVHEVTIYTIPATTVASELTGREILLIDWMLDDEG